MRSNYGKRELRIVWEYVPDPQALELVRLAILSILGDRQNPESPGGFDKKHKPALNESAPAEGDKTIPHNQ